MPEIAATDEIGLLGPVAVGGSPVPGPRARRLLTSLALAGGRTRSAERLIDDVWGDEPPRAPAAALHTQISRLRQVLRHARIVGVGVGYRLDDAVTDLDVAQLLIDAGQPGWAEAALALWRGTPGDDLEPGSELARDLRRRSEVLLATIDGERGRAALVAGDFAAARAIAEERCRAEPFDESAHLLLMRALDGQGQRAEALAVFAGLRRRLARELGIEPGAELIAANTALLTDPGVPAAHAGMRPGPRGDSTGLRSEASPLIGRDGDLAAAERLLAGHRVVTLLGPGGIGKTRFANALGLRAAARGDAVHFVPLASIRDDDDVAAALAGALGIGETELTGAGRLRTTISEVGALLAEAVAGARALLILDNCEQVIAGCAEVVAELIAAAPELTVVATSRAPLAIAAEQVFPVPPLGVDGSAPAVELFVTRARSVRPAAALDPAAVAALCRILDGLPLAIELAAARIATMTVGEITARLRERIAVLRTTDRTLPARHRTLTAVIEWSWDLLDPAAQDLLTKVCRFPGGFDAAAAAAAGGLGGWDLDDALAALVNQSLLQVSEVDGHSRYRMMEMVREFGEDRLAQDPAAVRRVDDAMAAWARSTCADLRVRFDDAIDRSLIASVAADAENLLWVLRRSVDGDSGDNRDSDDGDSIDGDSGDDGDRDTIVHVFPVLAALWSVRGLHAEIANWGGRILPVLAAGTGGAPPPGLSEADRERWQLTVLAAAVPMLMRSSPRQLALARRLLRALHRPELALSAPADFCSALALSRSGAERLRLLHRGARGGSVRVRQCALGMRTNVRENAGNLAGAMHDAEALRELRVSDPWVVAMNRISTGSLHSQQGDWPAAIPYFRQAVADLREIGATDDADQATFFLIVVLISSGALDEAERLLRDIGEFTPDELVALPPGDPERIAMQALCWADLVRSRGGEATALYRVAGEVLLGGYRPESADPGQNLMLALAACGTVRTGAPEWARDRLDVLLAGLDAGISHPLWRDVPQLGATTLAVGLVLGADPATAYDGAVLLHAASRLQVRRDYAILADVVAHLREFAAVDDQTWDAIARRTGQWSRRRAMAEVSEIVGRYRALRM